MKILLFMTMLAFTAHGVDKDNCALIIVRDTDKIEFEDIVDVIFWDDEFEYSVLDCVVGSPDPEEPEEDK